MLKLMSDTDVAGAVLPEAEWEILAAELRLSPRELQIVRHIFDDEKERTIAARLGISQHTVHAHIQRIYEKLGATGRVSLVVRVFHEYVEGVRRRRAAAPQSGAGSRPLLCAGRGTKSKAA